MPTSAEKLLQIINITCNMSREGKGFTDVIKELAHNELLPKKLLPKHMTDNQDFVPLYASKQAEAAAVNRQLSLEVGKGSGKQGKYTLADIKQIIDGPKKLTASHISPSALQIAKDYNIDITDIVGSGKDGRILLKDIQPLVKKNDPFALDIDVPPVLPTALILDTKEEEEEQHIVKKKEVTDDIKKTDNVDINISPLALKTLVTYGYSKHEIKAIIGSGKDGKIMKKDVEEFIQRQKGSETEDYDDDDDDHHHSND